MFIWPSYELQNIILLLTSDV